MILVNSRLFRMNTLFEPPEEAGVFLSVCLPGRLTSNPVIKHPVRTANIITVTTPHNITPHLAQLFFSEEKFTRRPELMKDYL